LPGVRDLDRLRQLLGCFQVKRDVIGPVKIPIADDRSFKTVRLPFDEALTLARNAKSPAQYDLIRSQASPRCV
jgi:hypothetical protein